MKTREYVEKKVGIVLVLEVQTRRGTATTLIQVIGKKCQVRRSGISPFLRKKNRPFPGDWPITHKKNDTPKNYKKRFLKYMTIATVERIKASTFITINFILLWTMDLRMLYFPCLPFL